MRFEPMPNAHYFCDRCDGETFRASVTFKDNREVCCYGALVCVNCGATAKKLTITIDASEGWAAEARGASADVERNEALGGGRDIEGSLVSAAAQEPATANGHDKELDAILSMKAKGFSVREISRGLEIPRSTVQGKINRAYNPAFRPKLVKHLTGKLPWVLAGVSQTTWHKCLRAQKRIENKYLTETEAVSELT